MFYLVMVRLCCIFIYYGLVVACYYYYALVVVFIIFRYALVVVFPFNYVLFDVWNMLNKKVFS